MDLSNFYHVLVTLNGTVVLSKGLSGGARSLLLGLTFSNSIWISRTFRI